MVYRDSIDSKYLSLIRNALRSRIVPLLSSSAFLSHSSVYSTIQKAIRQQPKKSLILKNKLYGIIRHDDFLEFLYFRKGGNRHAYTQKQFATRQKILNSEINNYGINNRNCFQTFFIKEEKLWQYNHSMVIST